MQFHHCCFSDTNSHIYFLNFFKIWSQQPFSASASNVVLHLLYKILWLTDSCLKFSTHLHSSSNNFPCVLLFYPLYIAGQVLGLMTKPIVKFLLPPCAGHFSSMSEPTTPDSSLVPLLGDGQGPEVEDGRKDIPRPPSFLLFFTKPSHTVHYFWRKLDDAYMRPVFGGRGFVPYAHGSSTESSEHALQWGWT